MDDKNTECFDEATKVSADDGEAYAAQHRGVCILKQTRSIDDRINRFERFQSPDKQHHPLIVA